MAELEFQSDLYRGTATYYYRFRPRYPPSLVADLLERAEARGQGRALDLACGTGHISFALHGHFDEILAVDQEPDMVAFGKDKAEEAGIANICFVESSAEDLSVVPDSLELVAIGNAFHRLQRDVVAAKASRWLRSGRYLALLWGGIPSEGDEDWQKVMRATIERWMTKIQANDRLPQEFHQVRIDRPDAAVLQDAGFELVGSFEFPTPYRWTVDDLIGFTYSTSLLTRAVLGDKAGQFETDLRGDLHDHEQAGLLQHTMRFAYELARRPT